MPSFRLPSMIPPSAPASGPLLSPALTSAEAIGSWSALHPDPGRWPGPGVRDERDQRVAVAPAVTSKPARRQPVSPSA